ncbi:MAG: NAD-dependent epimerase/dehydratase family protein [Deltaproteobacteria bacterium]|nr:NAD-dependent epimerase/dehydratase family protein [Deltaproteobacteria bacterium]
MSSIHLVTGGNGFLGHLITVRLLEAGQKVRVLDIWSDQTLPAGAEFINADVRDPKAVAAAMEGVEVVHHNAALVPITKSGDVFQQVNVDGSRIVAQAAVKAGVKCFIHMSSSSVYGLQPCPVGITAPYAPVELYGQSKMEGELAVKEECQKVGLPLILVRPKTILGYGRLGIFQLLFEWISEGRNVYVIGSGNSLFQFIHAADLMDAYMLALKLGRQGVYNVGAAEFGTMREALERVIQHAGTKSRVKSLPEGLSIACLKILDQLRLSPLGPWHYLSYSKPFYYDVSHLLDLGWQPKYSNDAMMEQSYDWYLANRDTLSQEKTGSPHRRAIKQKILRVLKWLS